MIWVVSKRTHHDGQRLGIRRRIADPELLEPKTRELVAAIIADELQTD
jgi:hypothetical protein